jgi:hypothetical protein
MLAIINGQSLVAFQSFIIGEFNASILFIFVSPISVDGFSLLNSIKWDLDNIPIENAFQLSISTQNL